MAKIYSYRGKALDTTELFKDDTIAAIGNMNVNAGGDIIDHTGKIVKSRDQVAREYYKDAKKSVVTASLLDDIDDEVPYKIEEQEKKPKKSKKDEKVEVEKQSEDDFNE